MCLIIGFSLICVSSCPLVFVVPIPKGMFGMKGDGRREEENRGKEEMSTLHQFDTWFYCRLYFFKQLQDGSIECLRVCLVANGYTQTYGVDYSEIFSLVAKIASRQGLFRHFSSVIEQGYLVNWLILFVIPALGKECCAGHIVLLLISCMNLNFSDKFSDGWV